MGVGGGGQGRTVVCAPLLACDITGSGLTSPLGPTPPRSPTMPRRPTTHIRPPPHPSSQVAAALIREHEATPFDLAFISGDLSYATVDPPKNEFQGLWDAWGQQDEPFASTMPFMMTVGVSRGGGGGGCGARSLAWGDVRVCDLHAGPSPPRRLTPCARVLGLHLRVERHRVLILLHGPTSAAPSCSM